MSFQWAVDGQIVRWLHPLLYRDTNGSSSGRRLPEEEELAFGHPGGPTVSAIPAPGGA